MPVNTKKSILFTIAIIFLLLAMFNGWDYGFFTLLRFVVFAIFIYTAWMAYQEQKITWAWIFGFLALLFNPLIPIEFNRGAWRLADLITAIFLFVTIFTLKFKGDK